MAAFWNGATRTCRSKRANNLATTNIKSDFTVERIYLRKLNFEPGDVPELFELKWKPQVKLEIEVSHRKLEEHRFEVVIKLHLRAELGSRPACKISVEQAGIFAISESSDRNRILTVECPNLLFPYAREAIDSVAVKGTFPAFAVAPVNLENLIRQAMQERQLGMPKTPPIDEVLN